MNSGPGGDDGKDRRDGQVGSLARSGDPQTSFGMLRALSNTAVSVLYQDPDLRVIWAHNVPTAWSHDSIVGMLDSDFLPRQVAVDIVAVKRAVLQGAAAPHRLEINIPGLPGKPEGQ